MEFYYACGKIGHGKSSCQNSLNVNHKTKGDLHDPWLQVELDAYKVVKEKNYPRMIEISRSEIFNTFTHDFNDDAKNKGN